MMKRYYNRDPDVIWDTIDGITRLCDARSGMFFEVNGTAALIWRACEQKTFDELASTLHQAFPDQDKKRLEFDTEKVVAEFVRNGLVAVYEPSCL
jgi:Coenzyme PQQ synthesis protein D (PqqD)